MLPSDDYDVFLGHKKKRLLREENRKGERRKQLELRLTQESMKKRRQDPHRHLVEDRYEGQSITIYCMNFD